MKQVWELMKGCSGLVNKLLLFTGGIFIICAQQSFAQSKNAIWQEITPSETVISKRFFCYTDANSGVVFLKGSVKPKEGNTLKAGDVLGTLPRMCTPIEDVQMYMVFDLSNNLNNISLIEFTSDREVKLLQTRPVDHSIHGWIFSGVSYAK